VSRFSHPTFRARVADPSRDDGPDEYKRTVCIACQRWFCDPKIPNPRTGVVDEPKCYFRWLGDRADTPEAQAEYLAAPYQGEGGLTVGWRGKNNATCSRCGNAAMTPKAQAKHKKARGRPGNKCGDPLIKGCRNVATSNNKGQACAVCAVMMKLIKDVEKAAPST
jgi:hypothetical protein